jgi:putative Mn2+ efflux pump MntP
MRTQRREPAVTLGSILLLAVGLAMDATAVAAARGMATQRVTARHALLVASFFGGFQALMPLLGWLVGARLEAAIGSWDHWVAATLLGGVGGKMLWEAWHSDDDRPAPTERDLFGLKVMLLLAVATSIDAWAVGITLPILGAPLVLSVVVIGLTTAVLSVLGLFAGRRFGAVVGKRLDVLGGLLLVGMGVKLVLEHAR